MLEPPPGGATPRLSPPVEVRLGRLLGTLLVLLTGAAVVWIGLQLVAPAAHVALLVVLGLVLMFILEPLVNRLSRRGMPRGMATAVGLAVFVVFCLLSLLLLIGPLTQQLTALVNQVPSLVQNAQRALLFVERLAIGQGASQEWIDAQEQALGERLSQMAEVLLGSVVAFVTGLFGSLLDALLVFTFAGYLLADGPRFRDNIMRLAPEHWRGRAFFAQVAVNTSVGGFIIGQLTVGLFVGTMAGFGCWAIGVPYALVIALLAGLLEMVPVLGPYLSAIPALLIALPMGMPTILWVLILFMVIQQIELNILGPRITGNAVGLHPFVTLIAILSGAHYGGLIGALVAVPVTAAGYLLLARAYYGWQAQQHEVVLPERLGKVDAQARQERDDFEARERARQPPAGPEAGTALAAQ